MPDFGRELVKWTRTLHIYLSMLGLLMVIFFSVTGIVLNHDEFFGLNEARTQKDHIALPTKMVADVDKLGIVEKLRADFGAIGALNTFDVQDDVLQIVFKSPARRTEVIVNRADGQAEVTRESHGAWARMGDLHKGKDSGTPWKLAIDVVAVVLIFSAVSGLILWATLPKRRMLGIVTIVLSVVLCAVVYLVWVP